MSTAERIKALVESSARGGYSLSRGVMWQNKRVNARPFPFPIGKLLIERRLPGSGFQTDALYMYPDGSTLAVKRTISSHTTLTASKGEER